MGYDLHIEREAGYISLDEWIAAVEEIPEARIDDSDVELVNPKTREVIRLSGSEGDVAVYFPGEKSGEAPKRSGWVKCMAYSDGTGSFRAPEDINSPSDPIRLVASKLAAALGAQIVGDGGEIYDWKVAVN